MVEPDRFSWRMPSWAVVAAILVMLLVFVFSSDPVLVYMFVIMPIACLAAVALLLVIVFGRKTRRNISVLLAVVIFFVVAGTMLKTQDVVRPSLRWLLWSRRIKAQVLSQPTTANEELKHVEWDGWGGLPVGDWTAYVVYDPAESLLVAAKDGRSSGYRRLKGIPCDVLSVRRLEPQWYSVVLGVDEWWDRCGAS